MFERVSTDEGCFSYRAARSKENFSKELRTEQISTYLYYHKKTILSTVFPPYFLAWLIEKNQLIVFCKK